MKTSMTTISAKQWDFVTQENLTAKEAVIFLKSGLQIRTFYDNIKEICKIENSEQIEKQLSEGLYRIYEREKWNREECNTERINTEEMDAEIPKMEHEKKNGENGISSHSVRKKVHNWMTGKNIPTDRDEVFRICFALNLNLEQAEKMLARLTEQGIHYRNKKEVVFAYCFKYQLSFEAAFSMVEQLGVERGTDAYGEPLTQVMKLQFEEVKGKEDLFSFILTNQSQMGNSHNTAYFYFCKMLSLLSGEGLDGEMVYSIEKVTADYLRFHMPLEKKTAGYSNVQKIVKKYWPGATAMKAMKSRSQEVNRKTLLLLYIVTGGVWDKGYTEVDETYISLEEFLENHCNRMNQMLTECGMSPIDPRNVFDYLILYCLRPENEWFMSERMEHLILELYRR